MTSVVRYVEIDGGDALLTTANADSGDEFASQIVTRVFTAADVGEGAGQTQDTTSDPTQGCLCAQFSGSRIRAISGLQLWRTSTGAHTTDFNFVELGAGANTVAIGLHVGYNAQTGVSNIYLLDKAADADGLIVAGDWVTFEVHFGDSQTVLPW